MLGSSDTDADEEKSSYGGGQREKEQMPGCAANSAL